MRGDYIAAQLLAAMDGVTQPLDFETLAGALEPKRFGWEPPAMTPGAWRAEGSPSICGDGGTDTIDGGTGQDVYIFGQTIGHVTIDDEEAKPAGDRLRFAFLDPDDVTHGA